MGGMTTGSGQTLQETLQHVIVTGNVRTFKTGSMGESEREVFRDRFLLAGIVDIGLNVVPNYFGHTGSKNRH